MSEPLSSTEIEDVLSSIRRLVSDDMRPVPRVAASSGDKLILTPALRVVQADPTAEPFTLADPLPMFVAVPRTTLIDAPRSGLVDVVASVGAAVDAAPDDWEAETGDSAPQPDTTQANPWALPAEEDLAGMQLESAAELAAQDHFEHRLSGVAAVDRIPAWAQEDDLGPDDDIETPVASLHGTVEPDPVWADAAEASVLAALAEPEAADDAAYDHAMRFDEDVLRELVRDMLREELAGKMGERITRNIRKLVRAEIARALASQEFE